MVFYIGHYGFGDFFGFIFGLRLNNHILAVREGWKDDNETRDTQS